MALKVIGAGFPRTATVSLKRALTQLGFGPCYHMTEVTKKPERLLGWAKVARGESAPWDEIFEGYASACDIPAMTYWRELVEAYPNAKMILTLRDPNSWFESMEKTLFDPKPNPGRERLRTQPPHILEALAIVMGRSMAQFGGGADREGAISEFNRHYDEVRRTVPKDRLLEHHPKDGWEPLCRFLGVDVPSEPYPRTNATEDFGRAWMDESS